MSPGKVIPPTLYYLASFQDGKKILKCCSCDYKVAFLSPQPFDKHIAAEHGVKFFECSTCKVWQYGLSSFHVGGIKLERFSPKNQHTQRKLFNLYNWGNGEVSKFDKI